MKKYLNNNTRVVITRSVKSDIYGDVSKFETTYGEAIKNNDLTSSSGTADAWVELHDSEYDNFDGCDTTMRHDGRGHYLETDDCPVSVSVFQDGEIRNYNMDGVEE